MHGGKIKINSKITLYSLSDAFMWLYMLITFIATAVMSTPIVYRMRFVVLYVAGFFGYLQLSYKHVRNSRVIIFILLCVFSWVMTYLLRAKSAYKPSLFLYSVSYMGMAINFASHRHRDRYSKVLFYAVIAVTFVRLVVLGEPIREFLKDESSYNFISVLLLLYLAFYSFERLQNKKPIPYISAILFAWLCILAYGRGGIATSLYFLLFITLLSAKDEVNVNRRRLMKIITAITVIVGAIVLVVFINRNAQLFEKLFAKFYTRSNEEEPRLEIWGKYLAESSKNVLTILFGGDPTALIIPGMGRLEDGNLHNAFLQMYSCFGLVPAIIMIWSFVRLLLYSWKKKQMYLFCMVSTIVIRSMTDKTAFHSYIEPMFYYIIFTWMNIRENKGLIRNG